MTKMYRQLIKRGKIWTCIPGWMDRVHTWKKLDRKEIKITIRETKWGRQTTKMSQYRCLVCGREEFEEEQGFDGPRDRKWEVKPTPEDTTKELFDVPK